MSDRLIGGGRTAHAYKARAEQAEAERDRYLEALVAIADLPSDPERQNAGHMERWRSVGLAAHTIASRVLR